jgi:hypothetical protein
VQGRGFALRKVRGAIEDIALRIASGFASADARRMPGVFGAARARMTLQVKKVKITKEVKSWRDGIS